MFKNRGPYFSEAGLRSSSTHSGFQILPPIALCRQYVSCSSWCLCEHAFPPLCHHVRKKSPCRTLHGAMTRCATLASRTAVRLTAFIAGMRPVLTGWLRVVPVTAFIGSFQPTTSSLKDDALHVLPIQAMYRRVLYQLFCALSNKGNT